jgi:Cu-Zn family superoxide dismutase
MEYKIILVLLLVFIFLIIPMREKVNAVCVLKAKKIDGVIYLEELPNNKTHIYGKVTGLKPGSHGIHIHEAGDLTDGCTSACAHYNPFGKEHGGPNNSDRHVGDLGNIVADKNGVGVFDLVDSLVKLSGKYSVIGRSIIVHKDEDDLGKGGFPDSKTTGHAGERLVCGVIGYAKKH